MGWGLPVFGGNAPWGAMVMVSFPEALTGAGLPPAASASDRIAGENVNSIATIVSDLVNTNPPIKKYYNI